MAKSSEADEGAAPDIKKSKGGPKKDRVFQLDLGGDSPAGTSAGCRQQSSSSEGTTDTGKIYERL